MAKIIFRQKAIDDLNDIWNYTFLKWSEQQADKYYMTIKMMCNGILVNPTIGKEYKEISKNLFGLISGKHIIFYQILANDTIEIVRILHERMDLKKRIIE